MKTKILILLLALAPMMMKAQNALTYTTNNGAITITGHVDAANAVTNVIIPDTINDYPVTSIGNGAFSSCTNLTNAVIGTNVAIIGTFAFSGGGQGGPGGGGGGDPLTRIIIPDSVTNIGGSAFYYCTNLASVVIGTNITSFGSGVFNGCVNLESALIGSGNIGQQAFYNCYSLTNLVLGAKVTGIGSSAFAYCGLASVIIPDSVTNIGNSAFYRSGLTSAVIGTNVVSIGIYVFTNCVDLTNVVINNSVIGSYEFSGCTHLTSITIPGNVTTIGSFAFYADTALTNVVINNSVLGDHEFDSCTGLASITVPSNVTSGGYTAFNNDTGLTNAIINNSDIGNYEFFGCTKLASIIISASVTNIGIESFYGDVALTNITFLGNAPVPGFFMFGGNSSYDPATVYYYYGTTGWDTTYGGLPTVMLGAPAPQFGGGGSVGLQSGNFGFTIAGVTNQTVVIEASTDLMNWQPVWTNTLTSISTNFVDLEWTNYPRQFYRLRSF